MSVSLPVFVIETVHVIMEVTAYSIHQLLTTLVIVLILDMRGSTVLVSSVSISYIMPYMGKGMFLGCLNHVLH